MLAQGFLRVKGQAKITKCYFLWVGGINLQSLSGHYFDAPKSTHGVFTSFSLSRYCCLHFCRNKFGLILAQGYYMGQRSSIIHKLQLLISTAPSPIDPVLTVQPDHCYIFFSLKSTFKNYFINYHNIIHLSLVRRIRQTLKTKPLIMLLYNYNLLIQRIPIQQP